MIRKLSSGQYRLYSRKVNPKTGRRRNLGTFKSRASAEKHEREVARPRAQRRRGASWFGRARGLRGSIAHDTVPAP